VKISEQLNIIRQSLGDWSERYGGRALVASDMEHLWAMCAARSDTPRVIICFDSEEPRCDFSVAEAIGAVDRTFVIAVTRGRGFAADRGDTVSGVVGNAIAFSDIYEEARDTIRAIANLNMDDGKIPYFKGARKIQMGDETILDGWMFEISVLAFLSKLDVTSET
jgi:hypothetical protein